MLVRPLLFAVISSVVFISGNAGARNWVPVTRGDRDVLYVDADGVTKIGTIRKIWTRRDYTYDPELTRVMAFTQYDCARRTKKTLQYIFYKKDGSNFSSGPDTEEFIVPDSRGESILNFVCSE